MLKEVHGRLRQMLMIVIAYRPPAWRSARAHIAIGWADQVVIVMVAARVSALHLQTASTNANVMIMELAVAAP
jgi:hypothetical protein